MLALPNTGFRTSIAAHNIDINIFCDWIESSLVFSQARISKSDVVDALKENLIYQDSDFAMELVDRAWILLKERVDYLSSPIGITVGINFIERSGDWHDFPSYAFCLAVTAAGYYNGNLVVSTHGSYSAQGELFEEITEHSFALTFANWSVKRIGWGAGHPLPLSDVIDNIVTDLCEKNGSETALHVNKNTKELGLDILAYYSFNDSNASFPVLLVQCATGKNWKSKKHTPDIKTWEKIVSFNSRPVKAFAMPFAYADKIDYRLETTSVDGVFMDRYRILIPFRTNPSSPLLDTRILAWLTPIVAAFPRLDS